MNREMNKKPKNFTKEEWDIYQEKLRSLKPFNDKESVSYTHLTLPTN